MLISQRMERGIPIFRQMLGKLLKFDTSRLKNPPFWFASYLQFPFQIIKWNGSQGHNWCCASFRKHSSDVVPIFNRMATTFPSSMYSMTARYLIFFLRWSQTKSKNMPINDSPNIGSSRKRMENIGNQIKPSPFSKSKILGKAIDHPPFSNFTTQGLPQRRVFFREPAGYTSTYHLDVFRDEAGDGFQHVKAMTAVDRPVEIQI